MSDYKQKLVKGSTYTFAAMVSVQMFSILRSIILARLLGPENLGILTILRDIGMIIIPLLMCGIPIAMTKFIAEYETNQDKLKRIVSTGFTTVLFISFIGAIIYFVASNFVAVNIYHKPILGMLIKIDAIFIVFSVLMSFGIGILQGFQHIKSMAIINIINAIIILPILYFFIISMNLIGAVVAGAIGTIIHFLTVLKFIMPILHEKRLYPRLYIDKDSMSTLLKFSLPLLLSTIILKPARLYGLSYLAVFSSYTEVGYFRVATSLFTIALFVPSALSVPLLPMVSELQLNAKKRSDMISRIVRLQLLILLPVVFGLGLLSKHVLFVLYGPKYVNADVITYLMLYTAFLASIYSIFGTLLTGTGRTRHILLIDIVNAGMFFLASAYLIDLFGVNGLGLLWLSTSAVLLPPYVFYLTKTSDIDFSLIKVPVLLGILFLSSGFILISAFQGIDLVVYSIILIILLLTTEIIILSEDDKRILSGALKSIYTRQKRL